MAIMVGALSARKLCTCKMLEHCLDPMDDEDDDDDDAEYGSTASASSVVPGDYRIGIAGADSPYSNGGIMGSGGRGSAYDTFGGTLH